VLAPAGRVAVVGQRERAAAPDHIAECHRLKPTRREENTVRPNGAEDQRRTADRRTAEGAITTFAVRIPRWPALMWLRGRCPLVRTTDRIEALVLVLAVVISLVTLPIAGAVGTAVIDSRRDLYAEQANSRSTVVATVTDVPDSAREPRIGAITVPARWSAGGSDYTGTIAADSTVDIGDPVEIWVDNNGKWVPAPTSTTRAALDAVAATLLIWLCVTGAAAAVVAITRAHCTRIRYARWQHGLDNLVAHGGGRP
jgi:hypothetical protein